MHTVGADKSHCAMLNTPSLQPLTSNIKHLVLLLHSVSVTQCVSLTHVYSYFLIMFLPSCIVSTFFVVISYPAFIYSEQFSLLL